MLVRSNAVADFFLTRRGRVFVEPSSASQPAHVMHAAELELGALRCVLSSRLHQKLATLPDDELAAAMRWMTETLYRHATTGAAKKGDVTSDWFEPLFGDFPDGIPEDTEALWMQRVLAYCFGEVRQPCPTCGRVGTSHLLEPCHHVVCDACFDGANYSACPVCLRQVARDNPFFQPSAKDRASIPKERVVHVRIDLAEGDLDAEARALFEAFCARQQPLSPDDQGGLSTITSAYGERTLDWLPAKIPLRENVARVFGNLLRDCSADRVMPAAARFLTTATDVLRLIAVFSGADASLAATAGWTPVKAGDALQRWSESQKKSIKTQRARRTDYPTYVPTKRHRWGMAKLPRAMRRTLLALLERLPFESLADDMLRHRSAWVWAGEFLHPHEYASRFPNAAKAFAIVRGKAPDGKPAPAYQTWTGRVEGALQRGELEAALALLERRPGELGRRFDRLLRIATARAKRDPAAATPVVNAFERVSGKLSTPLLVAMAGHLPSRLRPLPARVFFPKSTVALGPSEADTRPPLSADVVTPALRAVTATLLSRFATRPAFDEALIDARLRDVTAPFVERTASPAAVALPRGSRIPLPASPTVRLFLHWCEPEKGGKRTDVDLSVAFFDADWSYRGVCSYYQLTYQDNGRKIAVSSGDFTSAPHPDGASEYVDLDRAAARAAGIRYAVMVVNAYSGMPFSDLARAFAGFMLRDDTSGAHFDPRKVALRFGLTGDNGVFVPVVVDLADDVLHWVDVYSQGAFSMNNVAGSKSVLARIGSSFLAYFGAGARASMFDLARWHAAARCRRVFVRGAAGLGRFDRHDGEAPEAFARRIGDDRQDAIEGPRTFERPILAALYDGDLTFPAGSESYVLFPALAHGSVAAADWIR